MAGTGPGGLFITVTTATGQETRRYIQDAGSGTWFHNEVTAN